MAFDPIVSLAVIGLYGVLTLGIGLYAWRHTSSKTLDQYFLADRKIGWFVGFFSIAASQFSALTMIGFIAFYFNFGVGAFIAITGGALLFYAGSLYFLAPRIWKVGKEFSHITPSDTVAQYYDSPVLRYVVAVGMILALLPYLQVQFSGIGIALEIGSGGMIPIHVGTAIIAVIIASYTLLGGMKSVAWVDTMQGVLLLGGSFIGGLVLLFTVGGGIQDAFAALMSQSPGLVSVPGPKGVFDWRHIVTFSLPVFLGWLYHPYIWMRINYFENGEMMEHLPWVFMGILWLTQLGGFATVMAGAALIPDVAPDRFLLLMYRQFFPTAVFAVIASAAIAAMMSSASSICHSIGAVVSNDILQELRPSWSEERTVFWGQATVLAAIGIAYGISTLDIQFILTSGAAAAAVSTALVLPQVVAALYGARWVTRTGAIAGSIAGGGVALILLGVPGTPSFFGVWDGFWGVVVNLVVFTGTSLVTGDTPPSDTVESWAETISRPYSSF